MLVALLWTGSDAVAQEQLFAVSGSGFAPSVLHELNPATGALIATKGPLSGHSHVVSMDFDPTTGMLWGIANGAGPVEPGFPPPPFPAGFPFALNGPMGLLISIDPTSGAASPGIPITGMDPHFAAGFGFQCATNTSDVSFDSSGTLFVFRPCTSQVYTVSLVTGAATLVGPRLPPGGAFPVSGQAGLAFDLFIGGDPLFLALRRFEYSDLR